MREFIRKVRLKINKMGSEKRNKKIVNKDITLISNNCWAGVLYQHLGLKFNSPTIGLYFMPEDYLIFLKNFDEYINKDIRFIQYSESKYKDYLHQRGLQNMIIGKIGYIEIFFLHYKTEEEAKEKWEKRCKRINKENMIVKFNDQNGCTIQQLEEFDKLDFKYKLCFMAKNYNIKSGIWIKKYKNKNFVKDDLYCFHKYIDIIDYINNVGI